jgi:hypothetical protein
MYTESFDTREHALQKVTELRRIYGDSIEIFPIRLRMMDGMVKLVFLLLAV